MEGLSSADWERFAVDRFRPDVEPGFLLDPDLSEPPDVSADSLSANGTQLRQLQPSAPADGRLVASSTTIASTMCNVFTGRFLRIHPCVSLVELHTIPVW
jgi:hypothetical protein